MRGALLLLCILPVTTNESLRESAPRGSRLFLEDGFKLLMDESLMDDLRRMYRLFSRVDSVDYIDRILRAYILAKGEGARQEGSLQELHTSIDKIWHQCFDVYDLLDKTIRDCFEGFGLHVLV